MPTAVAHIAELWRYPIKSMRGEQVDALDLLPDGIAQDRRFAVESTGAPQGKPLLTGRERASMLLQHARVVDGRTTVETSRGDQFDLDDPALLSALEHILQQGHALRIVCSQAPLTECRPIALLSRETIARLSAELGQPVDARRFRANIVLAFGAPLPGAPPFPEDALVGHTLLLGDSATLRVTERDPRCRIVTLDPETAKPDPTLMKHLDHRHDGRLGIYAATVQPGPLRVGDAVTIVTPAGSAPFPASLRPNK